MSRLNLVKGLGPVLQIAEGWTVDLPEDVHHKLDDPGTWSAFGANDYTGADYRACANFGALYG